MLNSKSKRLDTEQIYNSTIKKIEFTELKFLKLILLNVLKIQKVLDFELNHLEDSKIKINYSDSKII